MARGVEGMRGTLDGNRARSRKKTAISLVAFPSFLLFFSFFPFHEGVERSTRRAPERPSMALNRAIRPPK